MSYNYKTGESKQLASANYFNDVIIAANKVYYAPSSTYQPSGVQTSLFSVSPDGSNKQTVLAQETWNIFRTSYDQFTMSVGSQWYSYVIGSSAPTKLDGQPANLVSKVYVDSPDGKNSLWVDNRDGKGVLLAYSTSAKTDKVVQTQSGLSLPVRWISNNTVIYRVHTAQETADYAINLDGGPVRKLKDVTNTGGIDKWYYY
jgi:hypothetical protein